MITSKEIADLHPTVARGAIELMRRLHEIGYPVGISTTYRDVESQNMLYAKGRTTPGNITTSWQGGQSLHNYRVAFDIYKDVKGQAYSDKKFFREAGKIWTEMGGEWGGDWQSFFDRPHMQFTGGITVTEFANGLELPKGAIMRWEEEARQSDVEDKIKYDKRFANDLAPDGLTEDQVSGIEKARERIMEKLRQKAEENAEANGEVIVKDTEKEEMPKVDLDKAPDVVDTSGYIPAPRYDDIDDVPYWGSATVSKLLRSKVLLLETKNGKQSLDLTEDMLKILVINDRAGMYKGLNK